MARVSNRIKKTRVDPADKLATAIGLPAAQIGRGNLVVRDVVNHNDNDQRHMVRSGHRKTVYRKTKIEKLRDAGIISPREALACEWYAVAHACRYDTTGVTARYGESSGGGCTNFDHLPKNRIQEEALWNFNDARAALNPAFVGMFERVVIQGRPLGRLAITFRTVARQLLAHVEERLGL